MAAIAAVVLMLAGGCADSARPANSAHEFDRPVPADEPRKELPLNVDLEPAQDCEERFDLALYSDRRIDLIAWDDNAGACIGRLVNIRYLSAKLTAKQLLDKVRKLARRVSPPPTQAQ